MNILIRVNSSSKIGLGHLSRCLVLAKQYSINKNKIVFACEELTENANSLVLEKGFDLVILKSQKVNELVDVCKTKKIDLLILDSYDFDYEYEKRIKERININLLCFDDTYEKHYCDILLNHNISAIKNKYKNKVPNFCELRCGSKYTLLRDEFKKQKKVKYKKDKELKKVLLMIGGTDHSFINIKILETLLNQKNRFKIDVVTTTSNANLKELKKYVKNQKRVTLHINSSKIAKLMSSNDFAIITPSVILNEVMYMKLPFVAIKTASNQKYMYEFLKEKRFNVLKKFNKSKLEKEVQNLISNYKKIYKRNSIFK